MNDYPCNPSSPEPNLDCLDDETKKFLQEKHDDWTLEQMDAIDNFIMNKRRKLREATEKECTIEDFEKAMKGDIDNDNEEGETK